MTPRCRRSIYRSIVAAAVASAFLTAPPAVAAPPHPNLASDPPRPLRYRPDGPAFVITDGELSFNRPLYGYPSAFRVDAGDRPEFSLYLPGRGGVLRLGFATGSTAKWFTTAAHITTRYEAGAITYKISDPALASSPLTLIVLAPHECESFLARIDLPKDLRASELLVGYGGAAGDKGRRDGDIGTESVPISDYFSLQPDHCKNSTFNIAGPTFTLTGRTANLAGTTPAGTFLAISDAHHWNDPTRLLASADKPTDTPVIVGRIPISKDTPTYVHLQRLPSAATQPTTSYSDLPDLFARSRTHWRDVSTQIRIDTPDPYLNAAAPALCVAADGVWDPNVRTYMHGAVAWRRSLLGWRGLYTGDALGQHDRTRAHLDTFLARQNTSPVPTTQPGPDADANLARSERALHSSGDLTNSHYDMNLVAVDALFRHLLWTGDRDYAIKVWPALERHLAWERRLFRRDFDGLPLYEAYAAIWASDDLQYSGGGATHATAYNLHHNRMAARVARWIGLDPAPYDAEADAIARALDKHLWLPQQGWFAEFKDYLGNRLVHPNAAVWTHYHTIDSQAVTPLQSWQMSRYVDTQIPHIPVRTTDPSLDGLSTLSTTNWHPYLWSTNNVVMAEVVHTALADFQSNRPGEGLATLKAAILDSMYLGQCPGNLGMATFYDAYRRESQRDFADAVGITSRTLVEGLFGVRPDLIAGTLTLRPGFPADWDRASLSHPNLTFAFSRKGLTDTYTISPRFAGRPVQLILEPLARATHIRSARVNGQETTWKSLEDSVGHPRIEITTAAADKWDIVIEWNDAAPPAKPIDLGPVTLGQLLEIPLVATGPADVVDPQSTLSDVKIAANAIHARATGMPGHRTAFIRVHQGDLKWTVPVAFEIRDPKPATPPAPHNIANCQPVDLSSHFNASITDIFRPVYLSPRSPFCSLSLPTNGLGGWASNKLTADIDDTGLRAAARSGAGRITLSNGLPILSPADGHNVLFVSQWDQHPRHLQIPLAGRSTRAYFLLAGSTTNMQSRLDNGEIVITYSDHSPTRLPLHNPSTWWPIEQDYFIDDHAFAIDSPLLPQRLDLKTLRLRLPAKGAGGRIPGGSATLLDLPLDPSKELRSVTLTSLSNESVIGLLAITLDRAN